MLELQTSVGVNSWVLHQNTSIFGPDADTFRPERWLGPKENVALMNENFFSVSFPPSPRIIPINAAVVHH